jgi:hypothetical protein
MIHRNQGATRHPRRCNGTNGKEKEEEYKLYTFSIYNVLQAPALPLPQAQTFSSALCSQTFSICMGFLIVRDQVLHPYKITGKII